MTKDTLQVGLKDTCNRMIPSFSGNWYVRFTIERFQPLSDQGSYKFH